MNVQNNGNQVGPQQLDIQKLNTEETQGPLTTGSGNSFLDDLKIKLTQLLGHAGPIWDGLKKEVEKLGGEAVQLFKTQVEPLLGEFLKGLMKALQDPEMSKLIMGIFANMANGSLNAKNGLADLMKLILEMVAKVLAMMLGERGITVDLSNIQQGDFLTSAENLLKALGTDFGKAILVALEKAIESKLPGLGHGAVDMLIKFLHEITHHGQEAGDAAGSNGGSRHQQLKVAV